MKKLILFSTAALLFTGAVFANGDKGKDKGKKPKSVKTCSGKECGKKKG